MKCFSALFLLLALAFLDRSWGQDETELVTVTVTAARDAVLYAEDGFQQGDEINRANGKGESLLVGNAQSGLFRRSLIAFELGESVPAGSVVVDARLSLGLLPIASTTFVSVFRVFSPWAAGTTDPEDEFFGELAQTGDVTWNYRFYHATDASRLAPWQNPGGDFSPDQPLLTSTGEGTGNVVFYTSPELIADVQSMLDQPDQHFGWLLAGDESSVFSNLLQAGSSENEDEAVRPKLEITYVAPTDFTKMIANYDALVTVAGMGEEGERDNHWKNAFEGGNALDAELSRPSTAVAAEDGTIYFTDTYGHAIRKVTTEGLIETVAGTGVEGYNLDEGPALEVQLDQPNGLAVMPNGNLYILDIDNKRVRKVTPDGQLTTVFHDETDPPFLTGRGLWVSPDEQTIIYGSRTALKRWTASDDAITVLADGFTRLTNIGLDVRTGNFLGADVDDDSVWRIDIETGDRQQIAGGGRQSNTGIDPMDADLEGVRGLAVSRHGGYFLTAEEGGNIWYVDTAGLAHVLLRGSGDSNLHAGEGQILRDLVASTENVLSQPFAITIAPNGDLVIVTNETGFIRVIRKGRQPEITGVGLDGEGGFGVIWNSQVQRVYLVEETEDLETWNVLSEVPSNSNSTTFIDPNISLLPHRLYRVRFYYP